MLQLEQKWLFLIICMVHLYRLPLAKSDDVKTWSTNTNFLNPRNWEGGRLPCENDRIIFPASSPVITLLPESLTVGEMVLPLNGEVIFPQNAAIEITGGALQGACSGKDVHFKPIVDYWYDPVSWNITSDRAFPRTPNRQNGAVPHAFQVPCPTDRVQFPEGATFQSLVLHPVTSVSAIDIGGTSYTEAEFRDLLRSHVGSLLFPNRPDVRITGARCNDATGCVCGNDAPEIMNTICTQVTPYCPSLECSDPISIVGSCCPICGVQMVMKYDRKFKMSGLLSVFERYLTKEEFSGVESFTAKTHGGDIQTVFVDGDKYKGRANKVAQLIHEAITSDINRGQSNGIMRLDMTKSENWNSGVSTYDQLTGGMSSGGVAALVILLIIGLGLAAAFYIYRKRYVPGFNFARFDLRGDKIELELGTTPHDELQPVDSPPPPASGSEEVQSKGFDNPVYGTSVEEVAPSSAAPLPEGKDFVENPMFMIFDNSSQLDDGDEDEEK